MRINTAGPFSRAMAATAQEAKTVDLDEEAKRAKELEAEKKAAAEKARAQLEKQEKARAKAAEAKYDKPIERKESRAAKADALMAQRRSKPQDSSGELTRRLVAAEAQFEVRKVMGDAAASLVGLRQIAAMSKEDAAAAKAVIKKLEKLLARGRNKIRSLDQEDSARTQKLRAERRAEKRRAKRIEIELRKKTAARRAKEMGYLAEQMREQALGQLKAGKAPASAGRLDGASEAAITAKAEAMAATQSAASDGGSTGAGGGDIAASGTGGEGAAPGGEPAVAGSYGE